MSTKKNKSFQGDVMRLVSGTVGGQAIAVIAVPILTRLYDANDFGLLAIYGSLLALMSVISSLRYELAIPLPEIEQDATNLVALSIILVGSATVIVSILAIWLGGGASALLSMPILNHYLWLLPVGVLLSGMYKVLNYWCIRTKQFGLIASTRWKQALTAILVQLGGFKLGAMALLLGQAAGQSSGVLTLALPAFRSATFRNISIAGIWLVMRRYQRFPLLSTGEGLASAASNQVAPMMFAVFFGATSAGIYALTQRILQIPMTLIGNAIGQVFFSSAAEAHRAGTLGKLVADLHCKLAHIGLPPALALMFMGPELFDLVFGENWRLAGECARWLAPWLYLVFVTSPMSTLFSVTEQQGQSLAFQFMLLLARFGAIALGARYGDFLFTVKLFAGVSTLCWIGYLFWLGNAAGNRATDMVNPTIGAMAIGGVCVLPLAIVFLLGLTSRSYVMTGALISCLLIFGRYWKMRKDGV